MCALLNGIAKKTKGSKHEKNLSTQQSKAKKKPWFSCSYANSFWKSNYKSSPEQGKKKAFCLDAIDSVFFREGVPVL
jgi:hypothetical protein